MSRHLGDGTRTKKEEYLGGVLGGSSATDVIKLIVSGRARVGVDGSMRMIFVAWTCRSPMQ